MRLIKLLLQFAVLIVFLASKSFCLTDLTVSFRIRSFKSGQLRVQLLLLFFQDFLGVLLCIQLALESRKRQ